jgi:hypothetical protein
MGRYSEKYWTQGIGIQLPGDDEELYGCEITDSETGLVGTTNRWRSSKTKANDDAWEDLMHKQKDYYDVPKPDHRESTSESVSYTSSSSDNSGCTTAIVWLVGIGIVVFVIVWLAINVVLPVGLLNSALALSVLAFVFKKYKTLFASLALVGGGYMLLDITNGWLSVNFVEKVVKNPDWISGFVYLNSVAVGLSTWLLIEPLWIKAKNLETPENQKRIILMSASILLVFIATLSVPIFYNTIQNPFVKNALWTNSNVSILETPQIQSDVSNSTVKYKNGTNCYYITKSLKAYFFNSPDYNTKRKGYLYQGDKIYITSSQGDFLYGSFTNPKGVTSSGWLLKNDLEMVSDPLNASQK